MGMYDLMAPREAFGKSKPAAERAVALDAELGEAYYALGTARTFFDWDFTAGKLAFRKAIALTPSLAVAHGALAVLLSALGRATEAMTEATRARALDPVSVLVAFTVASVFFNMHRCEETLDEIRRALEINPGFGPAWIILTHLHTRPGRYAEALDASERGLAVTHWAPRNLASAAMVLFAAGRRAEGDERLEELRSCATTRYVAPLAMAQILVARGDYSDALTWLERAVEERTPSLIFLNVSSIWDPLRSDPRFETLTIRRRAWCLSRRGLSATPNRSGFVFARPGP